MVASKVTKEIVGWRLAAAVMIVTKGGRPRWPPRIFSGREINPIAATHAGRGALQTILRFVRKGETLVVTRIDRLARSVADLRQIVLNLKARGVTLKAIEQPINTSTAAGKCFLDMLSVFAEFETHLRRERQTEGIAKGEGGRGLQVAQALDRFRSHR
jgi:DNA invertase Pin-like site-specific DNA recombinase